MSDSDPTVTGHAEVRAVLADEHFVVPQAEPADTEATLAWLRATVSRFCEGPAHTRRRALATAELAGVDAVALRDRARDLALRELAGPRPVDVMARVARRVPVGVLCATLGITDADMDRAVRSVAAVAAAYHPGADAAARSRADDGIAALVGLLGPAEPEAVAARIGLLVQACDATAGLVGNAVAHALRAGPAARGWPVAGVLAETLRLDPPVRATRRVSVAGARLASVDLAPGTVVLLDFAAANRDPAVFADPDRFDPERGEPPHLTFGHGPRRCPGADHALELAAGVLDAVLPGRDLVETDLAYEPSANLRVPARLLVTAR
ncbi:cytochrome P450 [Solihabitans fulvus]|uniref:Cytochrome P450 n=1 Tax=Solihabitans fulvus TaxID=1892852 RepID=A0A5B2WQ32_9PSEU|nr:cytochrome P450 [Solihabitans fulvus]KAA2253851.1 cytochrome P450 [Solihabitans fulvus]